MNYKAARFATLFAFCVIFEGLIQAISRKGLVMPDPLLLVALAFGASLGGRALAYLAIFEWLRAPFTKVVRHSSGAGESVEPKDKNPIIGVIGAWMSCPVCAGTWAALMMYSAWVLFPVMGRNLIYVMGAASFGSLVTRTVEALEWGGRLTWELTGHWNRRNVEEQNLVWLVRKNGNGHRATVTKEKNLMEKYLER